MQPRPFVVTVSASSADEADRLAEAALQARLAACAQVAGPVRSRYWWAGKLETATEWLCVFKTAEDRLEALVASVAAHHSYDVPEIVAVPIEGGHDAYLQWVVDETRGAEREVAS